jgi:hypothetical protein
MMNLSKRRILSLVAGMTVLGLVAPSMAQNSDAPATKKPAATSPGQPDKPTKTPPSSNKDGNGVVTIGQVAPALS